MSLEEKKSGGRFALRGLLLGAAPLLVLGTAAYFYETGGRYVTTENAYVKAEIISISASVDGRITNVTARDNQEVFKGDSLFEIDPRPFEIALAAAKAELLKVAQHIKSLRAQYDQGLMEIAAAQERIRYVTLNYERQKQLRDKGYGTQAKYEAAEHELAIAHRRLNIFKETNRMVLADLGGAADLPLEQHPLYLRAEADLNRAALDLSHSTVLAPASGVLSSVTLQAGEYVEAGEPLFALVTIDRPWVEANLKEVQLTHVEVGQRATVVIDSYPDVVWNAVVDSISPATGAEFALLPPQNATGNWVKVVQRIPVRLSLEGNEGLERLRAGMTATVSIDSGFQRDTMASVRRILSGQEKAD